MQDDDFDAARGIVIAVLSSLAFWALVVIAVCLGR
jgi:hypothetical protein